MKYYSPAIVGVDSPQYRGRFGETIFGEAYTIEGLFDNGEKKRYHVNEELFDSIEHGNRIHVTIVESFLSRKIVIEKV